MSNQRGPLLYDGNEFDDQNYFPANDKLTGFIEVDTDELLGGTIENQTIIFQDGTLLQIPSWSFTDGNRTFNDINTGGGNFLGFTTDDSGDIDEWYFFVGVSVEIMSGKSDTTANLLNDFCCTTNFIPFGDESLGVGEFARNTDNPGTWTREVIDDGVTIPEPTTLALLGLSLAGLGWSRRNKI